MAKETVYFVSDTHLGDGSGADRFRYPRQLTELLARVEGEQSAHLVLLGDFLELWATDMERIMIRHAPVFHALCRIADRHPVTYVVGNHDCLPWYYFVGWGAGNIRVTEQFISSDGRLLAMHGHQFDPFNRVRVSIEGSVKAPLTRKLVSFVGALGRIGGPVVGDTVADAGEALARVATALDQLLPDRNEGAGRRLIGAPHSIRSILERESPGERGYPAEERIYDEAARGLLQTGVRCVVMGHTHHPLMRIWPEGMYVNTGSWVWDKYPPTYATYSGGQLGLYDGNSHKPFV